MDPTNHLDVWSRTVTAGAGAQFPLLRVGDRGEAVRSWQQRLVREGFEVMVDGDFGPTTEEATKRFQEASELRADGVVGPDSYAAMVEAEKDEAELAGQ